MPQRLTKRVVDLATPESGDRFLWDSDLKGFGLKVTPAGRKSFVAQYRSRDDGRTRRLTIGAYGPLTVEEARSQARIVLGEAAIGKDPAFERRSPKTGDSFGEIFEQFLKDHVDAKRKKRTAEEYRRIAKLHLLPRWSERKLSELSRSDVVKLHREMADAPYAANRTIALLSKFFNWCEAQGIRPDHSNPCRHVEKYREDKRERFLSADELARLGQVLDEEEKRAGSLPWIVGAIRLADLHRCAAKRDPNPPMGSGRFRTQHVAAGRQQDRQEQQNWFVLYSDDVRDAMEHADYARANGVTFLSGYYWDMWPTLHSALDDGRHAAFVTAFKSGGDPAAYKEAFDDELKAGRTPKALCVNETDSFCRTYLDYWTQKGWTATGTTCPVPGNVPQLGSPAQRTCRVRPTQVSDIRRSGPSRWLAPTRDR